MASVTRSVMKISQSVCSYVSRKAAQNSTRFFSSNNSCCSKSTPWNQINRTLLKSSRVPCIALRRVRTSHHATDGDKDLVGFLKEEIEFEEGNIKKVPKIKNFAMSMDGTIITLSRDFNGESVEVKFDINENVNVDDGESMQQEDENENIPDIVSYPAFTVTLTKPSGNTLLFNCNCNTGINEDDDIDDEGDEQFELLRFDSVQMYNPNKVDKEKSYEAEAENMDGELYSLLMNTLLERGVNGTFVNDLIELSTSVEHRHYLTFLKSLNNFAKEH